MGDTCLMLEGSPRRGGSCPPMLLFVRTRIWRNGRRKVLLRLRGQPLGGMLPCRPSPSSTLQCRNRGRGGMG